MKYEIYSFSAEEKAIVEQKIEDEVRRALGNAVDAVAFDWTHAREDEASVKITIAILAEQDPRTWRRGFAGLTAKVMDAMGERLESVFPMIAAKAA